MTIGQLADRGTQLSRRYVTPVRLPAAGLGAVLAVLGSFLAWSGFAGFPGKMSLSGFPGGARIFTLVLAIGFLLAAVRVNGRRKAGLLCAAGVVIISAVNIYAIADEGGGLVNVEIGAWITLIGGLLALAAFASFPDETDKAHVGRLPAVIEHVILAAAVLIGLYSIVAALAIEEPSRFVSFLFFVGFGVAALSALGASELLPRLYHKRQPFTLALMLIAGLAFPVTQDGNATWLRVAASIGTLAIAAIGLNIVVGLAGLLDLGYIAFFGVGAYVGGIFSGASRSPFDIHLPFVLVIVLGAVIAATIGVVIGAPTLRLRGDYLAIVTLGFGEIFRITANNLDGEAGPNITGGPNGISGIPPLQLGSFDFSDRHTVFGIELPGFANYYFLEVLLVVLAMVAFSRLNASRIGRAWVAIREDETAAAAMGINTINLKLMAFAIGAFLAGSAGTVSSHYAQQVSPDSFTFIESVLLLAAVVLGGMGTIPGALIGAAALAIIPEKLRFIGETRLLFFGLALILMMRFRPEGIVPNKRRAREFHEADNETGGDAMSAAPGGPVSSS